MGLIITKTEIAYKPNQKNSLLFFFNLSHTQTIKHTQLETPNGWINTQHTLRKHTCMSDKLRPRILQNLHKHTVTHTIAYKHSYFQDNLPQMTFLLRILSKYTHQLILANHCFIPYHLTPSHVSCPDCSAAALIKGSKNKYNISGHHYVVNVVRSKVQQAAGPLQD